MHSSGRFTFVSLALLLATTPWIATGQDVITPAPDPKTEPPSFAYAQCANLCQLEQDKAATACFTADNENKPAVTKPANCELPGWEEYKSCLKACPIDTGPDPTPIDPVPTWEP